MRPCPEQRYPTPFCHDTILPHTGGHTRLSAAAKELLVEVDAMPATVPATATAAATPGVDAMPDRAGIAAWFDGVALGTSQQTDGAGFKTYYVLHDLATTYQASFATEGLARTYLNAADRRTLTSFTHVQLVDELGAWGSGGMAWGDRQTVLGIDWLKAEHSTFWGTPPAAYASSFEDLVISYTSHELHHTYAWSAPVASQRHVNDTDGDGTDHQPGDFDFVLYNYAAAPIAYNGQDYAYLRYGAGTTRYIDIR